MKCYVRSLVISLVGFVTATSGERLAEAAYTGTHNIGFNDSLALSKVVDKAALTFVVPSGNPEHWYYEYQGNNYLEVDEDPAGDEFGHYHLSYENACVMADGCLSTPYLLSNRCVSGGAGCSSIAPELYARRAHSMGPNQRIRVRYLPRPVSKCIPNGSGGQACIQPAGQPVEPKSIVVYRPWDAENARYVNGKVRVYATRIITVGVATPAGMRYTLTTQNIKIGGDMAAGSWNLSNTGAEFTRFYVTSDGTGNFAFDDLRVNL